MKETVAVATVVLEWAPMRAKRVSLSSSEGAGVFHQFDLTQQVVRYLTTMEHFMISGVNKFLHKVCSNPGSYVNGFKLHVQGEQMPARYASHGFLQRDFDKSYLRDQENASLPRFAVHSIPLHKRDFVLSLVRVVTVLSKYNCHLSYDLPNVQSLNFWNGDIANILALAKEVESITVQGNALSTFRPHHLPKLRSLVLRKPYSNWDFQGISAKLMTLSTLDPSNFPNLTGVYVTDLKSHWDILNRFQNVTHLGVRFGKACSINSNQPLIHIKFLHVYSEKILPQKFLLLFPCLETLACHDAILPESFSGKHISLDDDVAPNQLPKFAPTLLCDSGNPSIWSHHWEKFETHFKSYV